VISIEKNRFETDPANAGFVPAEDGTMWLDANCRQTLIERGLSYFDRVMQISGGRCQKTLPDREILHFRVSSSESPHGIYVKRHHLKTFGGRLRAILGLPPKPTPGRIEAANVNRLSAEGIAVMRLLAYGEKVHADGLQESFVITEELEEFSELQHYLTRNFSTPRTRESERELRELIRQVAGVAGRFHRAGYNHRDLYCCHFFLKEQPAGGWEIRLIDLQRVQRRRWFRRRWIVKDLAQLSWSAPKACIDCKHKIAFLHDYFGVKKLTPYHRRLLRSVLFKQKLMERKLGNDN
jgi:heptose I phosphotransferase